MAKKNPISNLERQIREYLHLRKYQIILKLKIDIIMNEKIIKFSFKDSSGTVKGHIPYRYQHKKFIFEGLKLI